MPTAVVQHEEDVIVLDSDGETSQAPATLTPKAAAFALSSSSSSLSIQNNDDNRTKKRSKKSANGSSSNTTKAATNKSKPSQSKKRPAVTKTAPPTTGGKPKKSSQTTLGAFFAKPTLPPPVTRVSAERKAALKSIVLGPPRQPPADLFPQQTPQVAGTSRAPRVTPPVEEASRTAKPDAAAPHALVLTPSERCVVDLTENDSSRDSHESHNHAATPQRVTDDKPAAAFGDSMIECKEDVPQHDKGNHGATDNKEEEESKPPAQSTSVDTVGPKEPCAPNETSPDVSSEEKEATAPMSSNNNNNTVETESPVKFQTMYDTYLPQAVTLFAACQEGLKDQVPDLDRTLPDDLDTTTNDSAQVRLATLVEGRSEPLAVLVADVSETLVPAYYATTEQLTEALKLLAKRQALVKDVVRSVLEPPPVASSPTRKNSRPSPPPANIFEDASPDRFWQWHVTVVDLLPHKTAAKQRRAKIRKLVQHLHNLVAVLQTLQQLMADGETKNADKLVARLSVQEEKVLQYQRDQAKAALEQQLKETQRLEKEKARLAKQQADAAKRKQAAAQKKQATAAKEAAAVAKKEAKRQEEEEKARREQEKEQRKQAQLQRQQNALMSFFQKAPAAFNSKKPSVAVPKAASPVRLVETRPAAASNGNQKEFNVEKFRAQINSYQYETMVPFGERQSSNARNSRRRRSRSVQLSVYVTVVPDNPFEGRPYADLQQVTVRNRYKFLSFDTDVRPPYHGTWSKKSHIINPRNPFKKDRNVFDYDYDSEAEWEDGDDEAGEDIENAADDEEEKEDEDCAGDDDGWLAADDDLDDDPDEETRLLRQKSVLQKDQSAATEKPQSFIAPSKGCPLSMTSNEASCFIEGMSVDEATRLLSSHTDVMLSDADYYLDPFPPTLVDELDTPPTPTDKEAALAKTQTFLRFVHHNSIGSKEKLVDELRTKHPEAVESRAEGLRCLESYAEKQKHPIKGFIWEVKKEVLEQYELHDLLEEKNQVDPEAAKKQILRTLAGHIHHSTLTSKDKLVDDLQATHGDILLSRAETVRHVEALAEKKKSSQGGVIWEVKPVAQRNLGLELGPEPSTLTDTKNDGETEPCTADPPSAKKRKLDPSTFFAPTSNQKA